MGASALVKRRLFRLAPREIRRQLVLLAVVLWAVAAVSFTPRGTRMLSGQVKGTDFLHFYTLSRIGATDPAQFANRAVVRRAQLDAVADSGDHLYPPVYGPQVALALSPLASFNYLTAFAIWSVVSIGLYCGAMSVVLKRLTVLAEYRSIAIIGAVAFPPFWQLFLHGQLSAIALCLVVGAWVALAGGHRVLAGLILGLLVFKPPLFVPMLAVVLFGGAWAVAGAMMISGAVEMLSTVLWVGWDGLAAYVQLLLDLPKMAPMMAGKPYQMHSLRAFWMLLVPWSGVSSVLYGISAACAIVAGAYAWRRLSDPSMRMSVLLLATVLASPHLYVYDLVILAPAWVWLTEWFLRHDVPRAFGWALYAGFVLPLLGPAAQTVPIQASVLCLAYLLAAVALWAPSARVREAN